MQKTVETIEIISKICDFIFYSNIEEYKKVLDLADKTYKEECK